MFGFTIALVNPLIHSEDLGVERSKPWIGYLIGKGNIFTVLIPWGHIEGMLVVM